MIKAILVFFIIFLWTSKGRTQAQTAQSLLSVNPAPPITPTAITPTAITPTAIIVSGGENMNENSQSFIDDLDSSDSVFASWKRSVFYADGGAHDGPKNLQSPEDQNGEQHSLRALPRVPVDGPADYTSIANQIKLEVAAIKLKGDTRSPFVLYFSDHGDLDFATGLPSISLWNNRSLSASQMRSLIALIPDTHPVEVIGDHCYGGAMTSALFEVKNTPRPNACLVSPASGSEPLDPDAGWMLSAHTLMHKPIPEIKKIDLDQDGSISAHELIHYLDTLQMEKKVTYKSTPTSSSDVFAERYLLQKKIADKNFEPKSPAVCTSPTAIASIAQFVSSANQALIQKTLEHYAQDLKPALKALGVSGFNSLQELQKKVQNAKDSLEEKALANSDAADDLQNAKNAFLIAEIGQKEWDTYDSLILKINELEMQLDVATSAATKNKLREDIVSTQKALSPYEERTTALQKWIAVT